jgi:hypothetical protein
MLKADSAAGAAIRKNYNDMLKLRETLIAAEEDRLNGRPDYTVEEVSAAMKAAIREVVDGKRG